MQWFAHLPLKFWHTSPCYGPDFKPRLRGAIFLSKKSIRRKRTKTVVSRHEAPGGRGKIFMPLCQPPAPWQNHLPCNNARKFHACLVPLNWRPWAQMPAGWERRKTAAVQNAASGRHILSTFITMYHNCCKIDGTKDLSQCVTTETSVAKSMAPKFIQKQLTGRVVQELSLRNWVPREFVKLSSYLRTPCGSGGHSRRFRSRFWGNIDFEFLTSTNSEFDAAHKNGVLFGIWGFWKP